MKQQCLPCFPNALDPTPGPARPCLPAGDRLEELTHVGLRERDAQGAHHLRRGSSVNASVHYSHLKQVGSNRCNCRCTAVQELRFLRAVPPGLGARPATPVLAADRDHVFADEGTIVVAVVEGKALLEPAAPGGLGDRFWPSNTANTVMRCDV